MLFVPLGDSWGLEMVQLLVEITHRRPTGDTRMPETCGSNIIKQYKKKWILDDPTCVGAWVIPYLSGGDVLIYETIASMEYRRQGQQEKEHLLRRNKELVWAERNLFLEQQYYLIILLFIQYYFEHSCQTPIYCFHRYLYTI